MKYLKITNKGLIEPLALTLIGASSKRDDATKIGMFGSGLKYSIAWLLRNNIPFKRYSGTRQIAFTKKKVKFRDIAFDNIVIDKKPTSMTTDMGMDWEAWFVIRELYCNALDEGEATIGIVDEVEASVKPTETTVFIKITPAIKEILDNWDSYFSDKRTDLVYEDEKGNKMFTGDGSLTIYRKGVRVFYAKDKKSVFHYDFTDIEINESRTIRDLWTFTWMLKDYLLKIEDKTIIEYIFRNISGTYEADINFDSSSAKMGIAWEEVIGSRSIVNSDYAGRYQAELNATPHISLPARLFSALKQRFAKIKIIGDFDVKEGMHNVESTEKMKYLLKEIDHFFKEVGYEVKYPIKIVDFDDAAVRGRALHETIYLSEKIFNEGRRNLALVIMEEQEHLITTHGDETRSFQNHLFSMWLKEKEERYAIFL